MKITRNGVQDLGRYYTTITNGINPCELSDETNCCSFSPYPLIETLKWVFKMLVLPGAIAFFIVWLLILNIYGDLIMSIVTSVLTTIGTFLVYLYVREKYLTFYHRIQNNEELEAGKDEILNEIKKEFSIGFVGDMMMMRDHDLKFHPDVEKFFKEVPLIVGNLEGIIPEQNNKFAKQSHKDIILGQLADLLKYDNIWLLCTSNNHSVDFGSQKFFDSTKTIQNPGGNINDKFNAFGRNDVPKVFIEDAGTKNICITTATEWSNQKTWTCTTKLADRELNSYYCIDDKTKFNILYPHWGYENERYARRRIQSRAEELLTRKSQQISEEEKKKWDLIFGHHPHTRQPVMIVKEQLKDAAGNSFELKKLVAFSGGNFTSGVKFLRRKKHIHGIIMRCEIGPLKNGSGYYAVGKVRYEKTVNDKQGMTKTVMIGSQFRDWTRTLILLLGIVAFIIAFLPRILGLYN